MVKPCFLNTNQTGMDVIQKCGSRWGSGELREVAGWFQEVFGGCEGCGRLPRRLPRRSPCRLPHRMLFEGCYISSYAEISEMSWKLAGSWLGDGLELV